MIPNRSIRNQGSIPPGKADYDLALAAWIAEPTVTSVCRAIGSSHHRAMRLINHGIPELGLGSIRKAAQEAARASVASDRSLARTDARSAARTLEARVQAIRDQEATRLRLIGDAKKQREEEAGLVRANRNAAIALSTVNARLLKGALSLASSLEADLMALPKGGGIKEKLGYLRTIANIVQRTAESSQAAVKMERLLLGEPTAILGIRDDTSSKPDADMSPEQAAQWLEAANRAYERAQSRANVIEASVIEE